MDRKFSLSAEPLVSIIMSVYNSEDYLKEAIDSILGQTYANLEFIIIDDASTDRSLDIVKSYNDKRILLIKNEVNIGLAASLNKGIEIARGKYIARMDSDDISQSNRIYEQVKYLENNPDILCYGSWARYFGDNMPRSLKIKHFLRLYDTFRVPLKYEDIKASLLFWIPFVHPTVMFNSALLRQNNLVYNPCLRRAQDYELWSRLCFLGKCANTSKVLLNYRISATNAGATAHGDQLIVRKAIANEIIHKIIGRYPTSDEMDTHVKVVERVISNQTTLNEAKNWLCLLASKAQNCTVFQYDSLIRIISTEWRRCCASSIAFPKNIFAYFSVPLIGRLKGITIYDWIMFVAYRLIK